MIFIKIIHLLIPRHLTIIIFMGTWAAVAIFLISEKHIHNSFWPVLLHHFVKFIILYFGICTVNHFNFLFDNRIYIFALVVFGVKQFFSILKYVHYVRLLCLPAGVLPFSFILLEKIITRHLELSVRTITVARFL